MSAHTRRALPYGIPAATIIAAHRPAVVARRCPGAALLLARTLVVGAALLLGLGVAAAGPAAASTPSHPGPYSVTDARARAGLDAAPLPCAPGEVPLGASCAPAPVHRLDDSGGLAHTEAALGLVVLGGVGLAGLALAGARR